MSARCRITFGVPPEWFRMARADPNSVHARVIREALTEVGYTMHQLLMPGHFQVAAHFKYGAAYTWRTPRYVKRKKIKLGHNHPIVWTGETRRTILGRPPTASVRFASKKISVTFRSAHARRLNLWSGKRKGPNFLKELQATTESERRVMAARLNILIGQRLPAALEADARSARPVVMTA